MYYFLIDEPSLGFWRLLNPKVERCVASSESSRDSLDPLLAKIVTLDLRNAVALNTFKVSESSCSWSLKHAGSMISILARFLYWLC